MGPSSDKALTFMKDHFLMDEQAVGTPLLVKSGVEYTRLAVETAQGADGHSHLVLYLGTGEWSLPMSRGDHAGTATRAAQGNRVLRSLPLSVRKRLLRTHGALGYGGITRQPSVHPV